jgi:CheY-like chemotaxis protein
MHANPKTKGRILCTEDDADSRVLIVFVLTREGYDVTATENSTDALALVKLERFDLLPVDNWMPGLSGRI